MWFFFFEVESAQKTDVYIICFHVPAGFAHTDDINKYIANFYTIFLGLCCLLDGVF